MFRGHKIRVILWGRLGHHLIEDAIGNQTIYFVTSTMVQQKIYTKLDMLQTWELPDKYITQLVVTYQIKTHIFS
jgi:mannitol-1-phosphate/altronate dehydrogenase